jgi:hypothetical protein
MSSAINGSSSAIRIDRPLSVELSIGCPMLRGDT